MQRLTEKDELGNWCLKGVRWEQLRVGQVLTKDVAEKLYGALFKLMAYENTKCSPGDVENFIELSANLIKIVAEYVKKCRWIPVEEKLPEPEKPVLLSLKNSSVPAVGRYIANVNDNGTFRVGDDEDFIVLDLHVNAWMPLPEPYREKTAVRPVVNADWQDHYMIRFEKVE